MKFLFLFLISFNLYAGNFASIQEVKDKTVRQVFTGLKKCNEVKTSCMEIPSGYSKDYQEFEAEKNLKEQSKPCVNEIDCQSKLETLNCLSIGFRKIKRLDTLEVYCTKFQAKRVRVNTILKAEHDAQKAENKKQKNDRKTLRENAEINIKSADCDTLPNVIKDMCIYLKNK